MQPFKVPVIAKACGLAYSVGACGDPRPMECNIPCISFS